MTKAKTKEMTEAWSEKLAKTIMERTPRLYEDKVYHGKWSYDYGVVLNGFRWLWNKTGRSEYLQYIKDNLDYFVQEDGTIRGYHLEEYNIDHINNGKLLFLLYAETGLSKYKAAADLLRSQLQSHPRTLEGVFWHKKIYPYQIWLDGLYMGAPFYLEYLLTFEEGQENEDALDPQGTQDIHDKLNDVTKQFILCYEHTKDVNTGLLFHAWDEKKVQPWCDKETGLSPNFWGRSMGWYVMALVDVLELLPVTDPHYSKLSTILRDTLTSVCKYQDAKSGVWYQVVDQGERKGNYLEASASSMIAYAIAKGIRLGLLEHSWKSTLDKAFTGILAEFVLETKEGWVNLNKNCMVAGLGGPDQRDGSFAYYISEPIICNDLKGVGAFLQACVEYENLHARENLHASITSV
ncbi:unsaturated rhamnogalacturonyl hydrolase [Paenibacillus turicensis]|uniref:Unsaturated rhamnogalacturonyl hydrolase n=1 Tax=Paenibacillus turicensis TaxID=160487 RepID=A0ABS4FYU3_9BACL|nr:glycoside hydrolase family 88 protein [Paenibacillus turicensis]MBP1907740.1 unsaturated rhamnogalacturonyl hydrolase [Paenibacillus turicensis]